VATENSLCAAISNPRSQVSDLLRQGDTTLQSLNVHASCSKKLNVGDQFGGVKLADFVPSN